MSDVTKILGRIDAGDGVATGELLPLVYDELRRLAAQRMRHERSDHTLQATALVHDAYMRLVASENESSWQSRAHFFAAAAQAMRRILIEHARRKARLKRGGTWKRIKLQDYEDQQLGDLSSEQLIELDETLSKLEAEDDEIAELVRLRLYAGLSITEAAGVMGISRTGTYQHWDYALSWFAVELESDRDT